MVFTANENFSSDRLIILVLRARLVRENKTAKGKPRLEGVDLNAPPSECGLSILHDWRHHGRGAFIHESSSHESSSHGWDSVNNCSFGDVLHYRSWNQQKLHRARVAVIAPKGEKAIGLPCFILLYVWPPSAAPGAVCSTIIDTQTPPRRQEWSPPDSVKHVTREEEVQIKWPIKGLVP